MSSVKLVPGEMHKILKPCKNGAVELKHCVLSEAEVQIAKMRDSVHGNRMESLGLTAGTYAVLHVGHDTMMSDTWMEVFTNQEFVDHANGDVLVAGLGIGLIVLGIQDKPEVRSITIVEYNQTVIDLIKPQLPLNSKVNIVHGDIFEFPSKGKKWDTIYFDIWPTISGDNWEEMKKLHRKFQHSLNKNNPNSWMGSWRAEDCWGRARRERREQKALSVLYSTHNVFGE